MAAMSYASAASSWVPKNTWRERRGREIRQKGLVSAICLIVFRVFMFFSVLNS